MFDARGLARSFHIEEMSKMLEFNGLGKVDWNVQRMSARENSARKSQKRPSRQTLNHKNSRLIVRWLLSYGSESSTKSVHGIIEAGSLDRGLVIN